MEAHYKRTFFEGLDLLIAYIEDRFNQKDYAIYASLESLLLEAINGHQYEEQLQKVLGIYKGDFRGPNLGAYLATLSHEMLSTKACLLRSVCQTSSCFLSREGLSTSERVFSELMRLKTYLRSTESSEHRQFLFGKFSDEGLVLKQDPE